MISEVRASVSVGVEPRAQATSFSSLLAESAVPASGGTSETGLKTPVSPGTVSNPSAATPPASPAVDGARFARGPLEAWAASALGHVEASSRRLDVLVKQAREGRSFSPAELLGMQFEAYQASQTLDFAGKVAEKATSGVKQVLQTQV